MATRRLGIVMYGVTGRMGLNQHLVRSILAIREQGGVALPNGDRVMPDPILVGRSAEKVAELARQYKIERATADLDAALKNPDDTVFFDAATTQMRADLLTQAIEAGKHIYCEKPVADSLDKEVTGSSIYHAFGSGCKRPATAGSLRWKYSRLRTGGRSRVMRCCVPVSNASTRHHRSSRTSASSHRPRRSPFL
jgi:hypothetical protein